MAVGVGIDETGMDQPVGGIDDGGIGGGGKARRPDLGNAIAVDQDVGRRRAVAP